jgi:hypothetical protein
MRSFIETRQPPQDIDDLIYGDADTVPSQRLLPHGRRLISAALHDRCYPI